MSKRTLVGERLQRIREAIRAEQPLCPRCLESGVARGWDELDHIIPLHKGGRDERDNLVGLCRPHHDVKTRADMGWRPPSACDAHGVPDDPGHHWNAAAPLPGRAGRKSGRP